MWLIQDYSQRDIGNAVTTDPTLDNVPSYFGRLISRGGMKNERVKYDLKKRLYLGPTSLDDSLAMIMSTICGVVPGTIAYDPFVGTASILVALSHFGAYCMGSDIDPRVLRGEIREGKRTESALPSGFLDVIVTDPPYGIRAGGRKSGKASAIDYTVENDRRHDHIPSTQQYAVEEVMLDLLHTASRALVVGGRLAYLIPTTYDFSEQDLPVHPCMEMVKICHQSLSTRHGRRAVFMRKYREYTPALETEFNAYKQTIMSGEDRAGFGGLMTKLRAALAADSFENVNVVKVSSACASKRKASKEYRKKQRQEGIVFPPRGSHHAAAVAAGAIDGVESEVSVEREGL
eukprot:gene26253-32800_t